MSISFIFLSFFFLFTNCSVQAVNRDSVVFQNDTSGSVVRDTSGSVVKDTAVDSVRSAYLDSVTVSAGVVLTHPDNNLYAVGTRIAHAPLAQLERSKTISLSDYLKSNSSVMIKEYGRGMRSYMSVRGTSASHSSVKWNGMELAVPTLGQTDLSHIPVYFFDRMDVHVGGSSVLHGDGSIGGTISLKTVPRFKQGVSGDFLISGGSFSTMYSGATVRYSSGDFESRTSLFYNSSLNNFKFKNNASRGFPVEVQNNSTYRNGGALQEFYKRFKDNSILAFNLWYLSFDREIQPSVVLNDKPRYYSSVYDNNLRSSLSYSASSGALRYNAIVSFASDYEKYKEDVIETRSLTSRVNSDYVFNDVQVKFGISYKYSVPTARSFESSVKENRFYLFVLTRYNPFSLQDLTLSAGMRAGVVSQSKVPLMPSLNLKYALMNTGRNTLSVRASVSGNSKVPSMNDRYWGGTNVYLKSESSLMYEGGADFASYNNNYLLKSYLTMYYGQVKNWIRWLPAGEVWRPSNIPRVDNKGVEWGLSYSRNLSLWKIVFSVDYSYTSVKTEEPAWDEDPARGMQLAYVPRHVGSFSFSAVREELELYANASYTGERTTLDVFDSMDDYFLLNAGAGYRSSLWGYRFMLSGSVDNITSVNYQSVKFYAMPGRNWKLSLRLFF